MTTMRAVFILSAIPAMLSSAALVPVGLNPGDHYRIAFVTSATHDSLSPNIGDYDLFVTSLANAPGSVLGSLNANWYVIGSTAAVSAPEHLGEFSDPIYRPDGLLVANGSAGLFFGRLASFPTYFGHVENSISITERGTVLSTSPTLAGSTVFTGTFADGSTSARMDNGQAAHAAVLGSYSATYGQWSSTTESMYFAWGIPDDGAGNPPQRALYAISAELTVPGAAVPEPGTMGMVFLSAVAELWYLRRRMHRTEV